MTPFSLSSLSFPSLLLFVPLISFSLPLPPHPISPSSPHTPPGSNCQRESNCWTLLNVLCSDCLCLHPTEHRIRQNVGDSGHHRECSSNAHNAQFTRYSTQLLTLICSTFSLPHFLSFPLPTTTFHTLLCTQGAPGGNPVLVKHELLNPAAGLVGCHLDEMGVRHCTYCHLPSIIFILCSSLSCFLPPCSSLLHSHTSPPFFFSLSALSSLIHSPTSSPLFLFPFSLRTHSLSLSLSPLSL